MLKLIDNDAQCLSPISREHSTSTTHWRYISKFGLEKTVNNKMSQFQLS